MKRHAYKKKNPEKRFWSKVAIKASDECWPWTGATIKGGYGKIWWNGRFIAAHRVAYLLTKGEIPAGMQVLHSCDNPKCVNPAHLDIGTHKDNMRDMAIRGRAAHPFGIKNGYAKLSDGQVAEILDRRYETAQMLAERFGVSRNTIWDIWSGRARKNFHPTVIIAQNSTPLEISQ